MYYCIVQFDSKPEKKICESIFLFLALLIRAFIKGFSPHKAIFSIGMHYHIANNDSKILEEFCQIILESSHLLIKGLVKCLSSNAMLLCILIGKHDSIFAIFAN